MTKTRSRSPDKAEAAEVRAEKAERSMLAPVYVEPGQDGDSLGIEGRHRHNMEKIFGYLEHIAKVVNDHAEDLDEVDFERRLARRTSQAQAEELTALKDTIAKTDTENKAILEKNDANLKGVVENALKGVWDFLSQNNQGIQQLFSEADASFTKLVKNIAEAKAAEGDKPSNVASGPKGLAFAGLRAELRKS